jgi:hypothetical protein
MQIRFNRVTQSSIQRFAYYASMVKVLDGIRDHSEPLKMKSQEREMWESLVGHLSKPAFPNLRTVKFTCSPGWVIPAIYYGANVEVVTVNLPPPVALSQMAGPWIQNILNNFPTIERFFLHSYSTLVINLESICEALNNHQIPIALGIWIYSPSDDMISIYNALQMVKHAYTLSLQEVRESEEEMPREKMPVLPSLSELTFSWGWTNFRLGSQCPTAPNLKTLRFLVGRHMSAYPSGEHIDMVADYQTSSPFTTFIYRCVDGGYGTVFVDEPKGFLRLNNLIHLEFSPGAYLFFSESFMHSIANGSPGLISLKMVTTPIENLLYGIVTKEELESMLSQIVSLHGIIRFANQCPRLKVLHVLLNATSSSNRSLWIDPSKDDEHLLAFHTPTLNNSKPGKDVIMGAIKPHYALREFVPMDSVIDDAECVAIVLQTAFPSLKSIGGLPKYSLWDAVDTLICPPK